MKSFLTFNRFFVYSEKNKKYHVSLFNENVNIILGRNTSGKSTLFQSILYTFGINEFTENIKDILGEQVLFRLDFNFRIPEAQVNNNITFIRQDDILYIKVNDSLTKAFTGIRGNSSAEHVKLKQYLHELFGFSLYLESKNEYKPAPIEAMFLPYYISQSVGWVYLRKSFSGLDFYNNFKDDYIDYYLGLENSVDRIAKQKIENELRLINTEIDFYSKIERKNDDIILTKLTDENFTDLSKTYVEKYKDRLESLIKYENEYIRKCNDLSYFKQRQSTLNRVSKNHKLQSPDLGSCPICTQTLPNSLSLSYKYTQEKNDTEKEIENCKIKTKDLQSEINSLSKRIEETKIEINEEYRILTQYSQTQLSYEDWLNNKANIELVEKIVDKVGNLSLRKAELMDSLKKYKSDEDLASARSKKSVEFEAIFKDFLGQLKVKLFVEDRYLKLYKISAFPAQGAELLKTLMAYHFAFNKLIQESSIHRFPFMLDAIFKEDIDPTNKKVIIDFIVRNRPKDTQLFLSIAYDIDKPENVMEYAGQFTHKEIIQIGGGKETRAFLSDYKDDLNEYIDNTYAIMEETI